MILRRPDNGCPYNTYEVIDGDDTFTGFEGAYCLCEDNCSWKGCKLEVPPPNCLSENKGVWLWDSRKRIWIAGLAEGMKECICFLGFSVEIIWQGKCL